MPISKLQAIDLSHATLHISIDDTLNAGEARVFPFSTIPDHVEFTAVPFGVNENAIAHAPVNENLAWEEAILNGVK